MNFGTRASLFLGLVLFAGSCLYPPWQFTFSRSGGDSVRPAFYGPVLRSFTEVDSEQSWLGIRPDYSRLALEWLAIAGVAGALALLSYSGVSCANKRANDESKIPNP